MTGWGAPPFLIAHRGFSSVAPENTLAAFERALDAGAEVLECDVQLTRDGVVAVIHDSRVDRTTDGHGLVGELSWDRLRRLDAGYRERFGASFRGEPIPRLEDLLELARGRAKVFVEIKPESVSPNSDAVEAATVRAAREADMEGDVGVLSFVPLTARRIRVTAPEMRVGLVFRWWRRHRLVAQAAACGAHYLVCHVSTLGRQRHLVKSAHRRGLRVGTYVVDDVELLEKVLAAGVDGVATNRVGELQPALDDLCPRDGAGR